MKLVIYVEGFIYCCHVAYSGVACHDPYAAFDDEPSSGDKHAEFDCRIEFRGSSIQGNFGLQFPNEICYNRLGTLSVRSRRGYLGMT
jgi:hypothetical protein